MYGVRAMPTASWDTVLPIDQRHPFFFDHQLDHVPGMRLVVGLLDLFREAGAAPADRRPGSRIRLSLSFPRLCVLEDEVWLHGVAGPGRFRVWAEQCGQAVCEGYLALGEDPHPAGTTAGRPGPAEPARAELVHRSRPENITIGAPSRPCSGVLQARVLSPPPGHFLLRHDPDRYSTEELIEASRQLGIMLGHVAHGRPPDSQILWLAVEADLPCGLPRTVPLLLRWVEVAPDRSRSRFALRLVADDGTGLGTVTCESHTLSRAAYQRIRLARSRA